MNYREFMEYITALRNAETTTRVADGIYDVTGIEFIEATQHNVDEVKAFVEREVTVWFANAYETETRFIFASAPQPFKGRCHDDGFNYGTTSVLTGCPDSILILAEND